MLMICYCTSQSLVAHHMMKFSRMWISFHSGLMKICCLLTPTSVSVCYCPTSLTEILRQSVRSLNLSTSTNLSKNRCWSPHLQYIRRKARNMLGIIYRMVSTNTSYSSTILKLYYVVLVRPHLEYAAQVWNPHLTKDINCLEMVQKFALRICSKNYHEPYQNLLEYYQLPPLQNRRFFCVYVLFTAL